jgi:hypothetical protein
MQYSAINPFIRPVLLLVTMLHCAYSDAKDVTYSLPSGRVDSSVDVMISVDPRLEEHNLGGMEFFGVWQHGGVSIIRFDLSRMPKKAVVKKASLRLYCSSVGFAEEEIRRDWPITIHSFEHRWEEGTGTDKEISWDGATIKTFDGKKPWPGKSPRASAGALMGKIVHQGGNPMWYEWPLKTDVVNEWITGKRPNYGMLIGGEAPGKAVSFASSESPDEKKRPRLILTLDVPGR